MEVEFPLIHSDGGNGVRKAEENKQKLENALLSDDRCPAKVVAYNFTRPLSGGRQSSPKAVCDLYIEQYLEKQGKFPEGHIIRSKPIHSVIDGKGNIRGNPLITYELKRTAKGFNKPRCVDRIDKDYIHNLCKEKGLPYRPYAIRSNARTTKTVIFWHPDYGYASAELKHWMKSAESRDPFRSIISGKEKIRRAKLTVFDNYLTDRIEILDEPPIYESGVARLAVFCKEHGIKSYATVNNIEKGLWFNCPDCRRSDFENIRAIHRLRTGEKEDLGSTVVALMGLQVDGVNTIKFGITSSRLGGLSDDEMLRQRYRGALKDIHLSHRCSTELIAREFEQKMLLETKAIRNHLIPRAFAGYTECRLFSKRNLEVCKRAFLDVVEGIM